MKTFPFSHHTVRTSYPERKNNFELGGGYVFLQKPNTPPARTFFLSFGGMCLYQNDSGFIDASKNEVMNLYALELFYQEHETYKRFIYHHCYLGPLICTFSKPFAQPQIINNGGGVCVPFTLEFLEHPI